MRSTRLANATLTHGAHAEALLGRLATALSLPAVAADAVASRLRGLFGPLADRPIAARAPWPSAISDDDSPFEFSLVLDPARPELRVLWESQGESGDLGAKSSAALATHARLVDEFGACNDRFDRVRDLFLPQAPVGSFALWHAARLWPLDGDPELKAYFNPQIRGRRRAAALLEEALVRLESPRAWSAVARTMLRGPELDEILYVSLDLSASPEARTKIYLQHHDPTPEVLRHVAMASPFAEPDAVLAFHREATGEREAGGAFEVIASERVPPAGVSPGSCLAFVGDEARPRTVTLHVPVRSHVDHDRQVYERATRMFEPDVVTLFGAALDAMRRRPLEDGVGLTSYLSLRSQRDRSRVTCYLSAECFASAPARSTGEHRMAGPAPVERMVSGYETEPITMHPFFERMAREPFDHGAMWLLFHNAYIGISRDFPRRLAKVIARVEHEEVRCVLSEQLYEELGEGQLERTHRRLFLRLIDALAPWRPDPLPAGADAPGQRLTTALEAIYDDDDPWVGVGAAIVIELLGKHVDQHVAAQFRRQHALGDESIEWLALHEALEVDHADESRALAALVQEPEAREAAWRGGRRVFAAGWVFFDQMFELCRR